MNGGPCHLRLGGLGELPAGLSMDPSFRGEIIFPETGKRSGLVKASPSCPVAAHVVQVFLEKKLAVGHVKGAEVAFAGDKIAGKAAGVDVDHLL